MMEIIGDENKSKNKDFHVRGINTLIQGFNRFRRRRCVTITEYDPTYKVVYLGNVLTGWAKGDSCTEKPLSTLWKNYANTSKPDVQMKLMVTQSGLKAYTKEHGLTEYWSHRVTFCSAPCDLPRIFCWVYRHEGRKLKQELRCHAVLCAKESVARQIANQLQARLAQALIEFKRDKISRQNARLSLANSVYENPSLPRRKILLSTGCHNYRPPLERSKSAPKLMAIEESLEEEEECVGLGADLKKGRPKFAYRNLSYSNRGSRMGGLHGLRARAATTNNLLQSSANCAADVNCATDANGAADANCATQPVPSLRVSEVAEPCPSEPENSSPCAPAEPLVEANPFGGWKREREESLLEAFVREVSLQEKERRLGDYERMCLEAETAPSSMAEECADENCADCAFLPAGTELPSYEESCGRFELPPLYDDAMAVGQYDSLVRSRRRIFENGVRQQEPKAAIESPPKELVKSRRLMFEGADKLRANGCAVGAGDGDSALHFELGGDELRDCLECADDDSATHSLRSVSSCSDTSSPRDLKVDYSKGYDLDSLCEEDSDESGFVEANDDKIRDLPHHHLVKSCILSSKSQCVEV